MHDTQRVRQSALLMALVTVTAIGCHGPSATAPTPVTQADAPETPSPETPATDPDPTGPIRPDPPPPEVPARPSDDAPPARTPEPPDVSTPPEAAKPRAGTIVGHVRGMLAKKYATFVIVERVPGQTVAAPRQPVTLDQIGKEFKPRILPVLVGTTVEFTNGDDFEHNVFSPDGETYNLGAFGQGKSRKHTFKKAGVYVQLCNLHPEMVGYVIVTETPHWARVSKDGTFHIPNVPAGTRKLKVWNERLKKRDLDRRFEVAVRPDAEADVTISRKRD